MNILKMKKTGIFLGGVLLGTVGVKILSSDCVKKSCTKATAGALKVKDSVLETTTKIQENMEDILAEAKEINELEELSSSKTKNVQEDTKVVQETIKDENVQTVEKNTDSDSIKCEDIKENTTVEKNSTCTAE
ncbi:MULTISPECIES: DUF6110 family protein [unclassified Clostridioides]|uniref:DUF6110 family protein n=1 Tax=unclassified Clostridioides TaxID=2635829 RepID=UPI001D0C8F74|nr:hypothetical protein [Clostridioides sp. ES-S-0001-02]MCC0640955.1 hypothetical protein [Clostridioides sp. ES-S-0049-03]MCC0656504.1 hypothetical protein [Clostridioides sp. ES-S-0123-01]MCC0671913.1 hypothetical protein [Clostridioides sp. ES-S-0145-01]MCC0675874.1 hypothetical protein [Clostridioides sp. ES-W-0018-02]MCC0681210.1 hypothetical protein [Clostridioides sp. ES-S-0005-03]MCC0695805.1 hypothetical protein [Clostridioides sp. ES-S-0048-02]MCC0705988.1 hypothetical protein [Cl